MDDNTGDETKEEFEDLFWIIEQVIASRNPDGTVVEKTVKNRGTWFCHLTNQAFTVTI